jgi:lipopolysaccharide export system permease protein
MKMDFFKLKKLDRYIIKKFLGTYVFMLLLIISIIVVFDINERLDRFINNQAPLNEIIFDYYINFIPFFAHLLSPLFVFLAVIFFTSKMANDSEVIAILSNGISFKRLMKPYMIAAFIIASFWFVMGSYVIPPANAQRIEFELTYFNPGRRVTIDRDIQFRIGPGTIVYFGNFNLATNVGNSFAMDQFDGLELVSRLTARSIVYDTLFYWTINDYQIRRFDGLIETIETGTSMDTVLNIVPNDFIIAYTSHETMTSPQLRRHIANRQERGLGNVQAFQIEYHNRIAGAFSAFILTLIGASLSTRKVKGGMGVNIGLGLALSMTYILFMTISTSFAVQGGTNPMIAAWIPNFVFAGIAWFIARRAPS